MYSIIRDGKTISAHATFEEARDAAQLASREGKNTTYKGSTGSLVGVWSGPVVNGRGVVKHVSFAAGHLER